MAQYLIFDKVCDSTVFNFFNVKSISEEEKGTTYTLHPKPRDDDSNTQKNLEKRPLPPTLRLVPLPSERRNC